MVADATVITNRRSPRGTFIPGVAASPSFILCRPGCLRLDDEVSLRHSFIRPNELDRDAVRIRFHGPLDAGHQTGLDTPSHASINETPMIG